MTTQPWPLASWRFTTYPSSSSHRNANHSSRSRRPRNTHHSVTIAIIDIPHIVSSICDNLSPTDIWNCYRVNTTWRDMFGPYRFREIEYANLSATQTCDILENAHHIRSLEISLTEGEYFLHKSSTSWPSCPFRPLVEFDMDDHQPRYRCEDDLYDGWGIQCKDKLFDSYLDWPLPVNEKTLKWSKQLYTNQILSYKHRKKMYKT